MTTRLEFVDAGEEPERMPEPTCPIGITGHQWILTIEEGTVGLTLPKGEICPPWDYHCEPGTTRPVCQIGLENAFENDAFEMERQLVKLEIEIAGAPPDGQYPIVRIEPL